MGRLENVKRETLAETVYLKIRDAILDGDLPHGQELNQVRMAQELNVSRVPLREALRRLQAERLVAATPFHQFVVSTIQPDRLLEIIDIREELEVFAIRRQVPLFTPDLERQLRAQNEALRNQDDRFEWFAGDVSLHELINGPETEAARLVRELRTHIHRHLRIVVSSHSRQKEACTEHDRIIDAMAAGDADAAEAAIRSHIEHTRTVLASYLRDHQQSSSPSQGETASG